MYKDKDKQRDANRKAQAKFKANIITKASQEGITPGITEQGITEGVGLGITKPERTAQGNIRVSKPGDDDYEPQCETTRAFIEGRDKRPDHITDINKKVKRGKDIKCFADLPLDVQVTINRVSETKEEKQKRTVVAIKYQHETGGLHAGLGRVVSQANKELLNEGVA